MRRASWFRALVKSCVSVEMTSQNSSRACALSCDLLAWLCIHAATVGLHEHIAKLMIGQSVVINFRIIPAPRPQPFLLDKSTWQRLHKDSVASISLQQSCPRSSILPDSLQEDSKHVKTAWSNLVVLAPVTIISQPVKAVIHRTSQYSQKCNWLVLRYHVFYRIVLS